jgi:hypothetical protein
VKPKEQPGKTYCDNCGAEQPVINFAAVAAVMGAGGTPSIVCKCGGDKWHGTIMTGRSRPIMHFFTAKERRLIRMALETAANIAENDARPAQEYEYEEFYGYIFDSAKKLRRRARDYRELKKRFKEKQ